MAIAFKQIILPRHHLKVPTGQAVAFYAQLINTGIVDRLDSPDYLPIVTIYDPTGTVVVQDAEMTYISPTGHYRYTYRIPYDSPLGPYTGSFKALNSDAPGGDEAHLERAVLWNVIATSEGGIPFDWSGGGISEPDDPDGDDDPNADPNWDPGGGGIG